MKTILFKYSFQPFIYIVFFSFISSAATFGQVSEETTVFHFPEGQEAMKLISRDPIEGFFKWIQPLDMRLQMKLGPDTLKERSALLSAYKKYLGEDIAQMSDFEKDRLRKMLSKCRTEINELNPSLLPDTVSIVKLNGLCYGPSAFYTRQEGIFIPATMLLTMNDESLQNVMYHELFHIISRYRPELKEDLYLAIGYKLFPSETYPAGEFLIPDQLKSRWLLNPDGLAYPVLTILDGPDGPIIATPVIYSNESNYNPAKPNFFQYLAFELFEVKHNLSTSAYEIRVSEDGSSTLEGSWVMKAHGENIKDNTQYIIHPDEVLADNFALLFRGKDHISKLSEPGQKLLTDLRKALGTH